MKIQFKAKIESLSTGTEIADFVRVPRLTRSHVDMNAARKHSRYGSYANSDLFPGMLARIIEPGFKRISKLPENIKIDRSKFLAVFTLDV